MRSILAYAFIQVVVLLSFISSTAISVAFPNITEHYNTSLVLAGWVLSIYQLVAACSMVLMGKVSDILGRKNTFIICSALFTAGSLLGALAPNIQLLIAARFIQSVGGGGFVPTAIGMIVDILPNHRKQAIGMNVAIANLGGIIGPYIGSWLITGFGWQSIFWFNIPIVILAVIPLLFLLKSSVRKKVHIDLAGAGLFSAFLLTFMFGLSQVAHSETASAWLITGLIFAVSIGSLVFFIRHELKATDPIIDLVLLRLRPFAAANVYNFIFGMCIFGFANLIPLYAVSVYGMTTLESGYVLMARAIGMIVASVGVGFLLGRLGYRKPMLLGSIILSAGLLILGFEFSQVKILGVEISSVVFVSIMALVIGLGMGVSTPASSNACLDLMPERASTIQGVRGMFRQSGGAISIALTTLIIQFIGNISTGFTVVFIFNGLLVLLTIPFIFAMPDRDRGKI